MICSSASSSNGTSTCFCTLRTSKKTALSMILPATICLSLLIQQTAGIEAFKKRMMWSKDEYPDYCSSPKSMQQRTIPAVQQDVPGLQILQVFATIRHGSRTPWAAYDCWDGYVDDPAQSKWDCELKTLISPPRDRAKDREGSFLFEKVYDALKPPLSNELGGTCQIGQLLQTGYDQHLANGLHLRDAYFSDDDELAYMKLFESAHYDERPYEESTYLRSDDDQRVLMSGQVLLGGIFDVSGDTVMVVHSTCIFFYRSLLLKMKKLRRILF